MSSAPLVHTCPHRVALLFWTGGERRGDYRGDGVSASEIGRRLAVSRSLRRRAGAVGGLRAARSNVLGSDGSSNRANARRSDRSGSRAEAGAAAATKWYAGRHLDSDPHAGCPAGDRDRSNP